MLCSLIFNCKASKKQDNTISEILKTETHSKPKLVVGIVVDQMRYDFLTRFYSKYSSNGFKRLINDGFNLKNNHYNYIPTYTGPGHASIFTGATPNMHAIISNYWYDKYLDQSVYCAGDKTVTSIGTSDKAGKMSPRRMKTTTFGDENRLFTQFKGKTIGISIKDRGAILPAGHTANGAYWFHGKNEGVFITSDFYMTNLPNWVKVFNNSNSINRYLKEWDTFLPIETYTESGADINDFESGFNGKIQANFPYDLKSLSAQNDNYDILKATPYGNSIVVDFSIEAIKNEALGKDDITDVLTVSFSSTDYVGHNFGVNSKEVEDTYIRLDRDLARLLDALDKHVGEGAYTLFLTSDHGAVEVPAYLKSKNIPAGYLSQKGLRDRLENHLQKQFGYAELIKKINNNQIFLNTEIIRKYKLSINSIEESLVNKLVELPHIYKAYSSKTMQTTQFATGIPYLLQNGYNQKFSGNVIYDMDPAHINYSKTGSTHGSGLNYDTHVPLIFYGFGIARGESLQKTEITSIAPTISALLGISFPNGSSSNVLDFVLEK